MKSDLNPSKLDVAAVAAAAAVHSGRLPLAQLERLAQSADASADVAGREVEWSVRGERRVRTGAPQETWLHLQARVALPLTCQRCLQPVDHDLQVDTSLRFVVGEAEAARLDAEIEEDVLPLTRFVDVAELIEDELLLALPLVPMHGVCPQPLVVADQGEPADAPGPSAHPFAALKALKTPRSPH